MQAVDVTGLSEREIEAIEKGERRIEMGDNGIAQPAQQKKVKKMLVTNDSIVPIKVKDTKKNRQMLAKYGDRVFDGNGKVNYKKLPTEVLLGKLVRRKGDSRRNLLEILDKPFCRKLLDKIPKSELKYKSKNELKKNIRKFLGLKAEKTSKPDKSRKESSKKNKKEDAQIGPMEKD